MQSENAGDDYKTPSKSQHESVLNKPKQLLTELTARNFRNELQQNPRNSQYNT